MNVIIVPIIIIQCILSLILIKMIMIRCDGLPQCPHHDDEEGCQLPDTARYALSLFIILIISIYNIIAILNISYIIIRGAPNLVLIKLGSPYNHQHRSQHHYVIISIATNFILSRSA